MAKIDIVLTPPVKGMIPITAVASPSIDLENDYAEFVAGFTKDIPNIWSVVNIKFNASMSIAAGGDRFLQLQQKALFGGQLEVILMGYQSSAIAALETGNLLLSPMGIITNGVIYLGSNNDDHFEVPRDSMLLSGYDRLKFMCGNGQAGDIGHVYMVLKYMNDILGVD